MRLDSLIECEDFDLSQMALDLAAFLLRYKRDIDYTFFSEDPKTQERIRRAETYRSWADIEDLANQHDSQVKNFTEHERTAAKAFNELYTHIEKIKSEMREDMADLRRENTWTLNEVDWMWDQQLNQPQGLSQADKKNILDKVSDVERFINNTVLKRIDLVEQNLEGF